MPLETATAWRAPQKAANSISKAATSGPPASWPPSSTRATAARSSSPICGAEMGRSVGGAAESVTCTPFVRLSTSASTGRDGT